MYKRNKVTLEDVVARVAQDWDEQMLTSPLGLKYEFESKNEIYTNLAKMPLNDDIASQWVRDHLDNHFTFIPTTKASGKWYFWNGAFHEEDKRGVTSDMLAVHFARALNRVLGDIRLKIMTSDNFTKEDKDALTKALEPGIRYGNNAQNERGIGAMRKRIQLMCSKDPNYFDNDQQYIVFKNGKVIDQMGDMSVLLDPDPRRPVSKTLGIIYNEDSQEEVPQRWLSALNQWVPDKEVQKYLQVAAGAAMSGRGDAKNIVVLVGVSNTGKSTYINILKEIFGDGEHGYAGVLPATAIVQKYGGTSNFEQYKARGKRFLYLSEPQNTKTDDAFLKNLSGGGETITTAEKGQNTADWVAQCVLHIASNHVPKFDTHDMATVDRMNLVGFDHVFKNTNQGSAGNFASELVDEEGGGIFQWILEGMKMYDKLGYIPVPESIKSQSKSNVVESSAPLRWLQEVVDDDQYIIDTKAFMIDMVEPKEAYSEFQQWCFENSEKIISKKIWLSEIERFNEMPKAKKGVRSGGKSRVWGLVKMSTQIERESTYVDANGSATGSGGAKVNSVNYGDLLRGVQ